MITNKPLNELTEKEKEKELKFVRNAIEKYKKDNATSKIPWHHPLVKRLKELVPRKREKVKTRRKKEQKPRSEIWKIKRKENKKKHQE